MEPVNYSKNNYANNRNSTIDTGWFGFVTGLLAPVITFLVYYQINYSFLKLNTFIFDIFVKNIFTPLLSLCTVANLGLFFVYYWLYKNYAARGVIGATLVYALIVVILKFVI